MRFGARIIRASDLVGICGLADTRSIADELIEAVIHVRALSLRYSFDLLASVSAGSALG